MDFLIVELYLFDKFISIGTHIIHSVPVHGKIGFKCFMFLQQALKTKSQIKTVLTQKINKKQQYEGVSKTKL